MSLNRFLWLFFWVFVLSCPTIPLYAQIIYVYNGTLSQITKINLSDCSFCDIAPSSGNFGDADVVVLPNGDLLNIGSTYLRRTLPPPSAQEIWGAGTGTLEYGSGQLASNGLVYLGGAGGLGSFNPANNTLNFIGPWPTAWPQIGVHDIFFVNNLLHGIVYDAIGQSFLIQIDVNNPSQSLWLGPATATGGAEGGTWNGNAGYFASDNLGLDIYFYNINTGNSTLVCDLPDNLVYIVGLSFPPAGTQEPPCLCSTNAGVLGGSGTFQVCSNETLTFPAVTQTVLDGDDILQYILFSNPNDTAGSIVATSASPSFTFGPPLQTGVTYYVAAMAGNNLNGNVDLSDPCLDFSNARAVAWRPLPTVQFSLAGGNLNLCPGDCRVISATFTGTAPFSLTYISPSGTNTTTFSTNSGTFTVCAPLGTPAGPLQVQATVLADAWCTCQ